MLRTRIITGVLYGAALAATLLLGSPTFVATVLGALWLVGAWEWAGFARCSPQGRLVYAAALGSAALAIFLWFGARFTVPLMAVALVWWLVALVLVRTYPRPLGAPFVGFAGVLVLVPSWFLLVRLHASAAFGAELALLVLLIVWAADVGGFFVGRSLGRTKLASAVSPGKTWEGLAGGLAGAALVAAGAAVFLDLPVVGFVALGVGTALASVLGDLAESIFKRNVGLKDSGSLLPGHGGILDRIDSLTAAVPVFVAGLHLLRLPHTG